MQIVTNVYPHTWPYLLNAAMRSLSKDVRVRQAANYAINRPAMVGFARAPASRCRAMVCLFPPRQPITASRWNTPSIPKKGDCAAES